MNLEQADTDRVLVVIPCLNEEANIARVVAAMQQDREKCDLLVVVADGGSTDRTPAIIRELASARANIRLIDNPARLQSAGINRAMEIFGEGRRWLVRADAHADYPDHYVSFLVAEAKRIKAASVVVAMRSEGRKWFQKAAAVAQNSLLGTGGSAHRVGGEPGFVDHGHHALFDLEMFRSIKGYDETQSHNEDAEFDVRLQRAGGRIWLTRTVSITYYPREQAAGLYRQYRNYGRGRALTILRHRVRPKFRQLLPAAVVPSLGILPAAHWSAIVVLPACAWLGVCLVYGMLLGLRSGKSYAFASAWAAIIMHTAWSIGFWRGLFEVSASGHRRRIPEYQ